jgi:tetratricopeptide (TPR) repeat protein
MDRDVVESRFSRFARSPFLWLFIGAYALRLVYIIQSRQNPLFGANFVDAYMYDLWANELVAGRWVKGAVSHFLPIYPVFLAFIKSILGDSETAVKLVQSIMSSAAAVLVALIGEKLRDRRTGIIAGVLYASTWMLVLYDSEKYAESFCISFLVLSLYLLVVPRAHWGAVLAAGFAFALSAGARPNLLLLVPFVMLWLLWSFWQERRRRWIMPALFAVGTFLIIGPIAARNYQLTGELMLRKQSAWNFYAAVNPDFGGLHPAPGVEFEKYMRLPIRAGARNETDIEEFWKSESWRIVEEQPVAVAGVFLERFLIFLSATEWSQEFDVDAYRSYSSVLSLPLPGAWLLIPFGLAGMLLWRPRTKEQWLLFLFIVISALSIIPFKGTGRYRLPTLMLMAIPAAAVIALLVEAISRRDLRRLAIASGLILLFGAVSWPDWTDLNNRRIARHEFYIALRLSQLDRRTEAITHYQKSMDEDPTDADSAYRIGQILHEAGQDAKAATWLEEALRREADFPEPHVALGEIALAEGDVAAALQHFKSAVELQPNSSPFREKLGRAAVLAGEKELAMENLDHVIRRTPDPLKLLELATQLEEVGALQEALGWYGSLIEDESQNPEVRAAATLAAGELFEARLQDRERALHFYRMAQERFPGTVGARMSADAEKALAPQP